MFSCTPFVTIIISFIFLSCNSSNSPVTPHDHTNRPPNTPSSPLPHDGDTSAYRNSVLTWSGGDPNGDTVTYSVFVYLDSGLQQFYAGASHLTTNSYSFDQPMPFNTKYYWYVVASDGPYTVQGPVWRFRTLRPANLRPYIGTDYVDSCSYDRSTHTLTTIFYFVNNGGVAAGGGFKIGLYLSVDTILTGIDPLLGYAYISNLNPGQGGEVQGELDLTDLPLPAGDYYVIIYIDIQNDIVELDKSDNGYVFPHPITLP